MTPPRASVYLNQAGTSWPKPAPVQQAVQDALQADPVTWAERLEAAHEALSSALSVSAQDLLLTPGGTSALAVALSDHDWRRGDRLIVSAHEHLALERPARALEARGVEVVVARPGRGESVDLDFVQDVLRRGGVRGLAFTAASNVTGALAPTEDLVALAHAHGAWALVDAAQVAGWWPLDLAALGADMVAFAGHKGLHGPWGVGGLYTAPGLRFSTPRGGASNPRPGYCDVGSVDRAALAGLAAALGWLAAPAQADRLARARALAARLWSALEGHPRVTLHGPAEPEARMPTVAITVEGAEPAALAARLAARGVIASGGQQCAPLAHRTLGTYPQGVLRFSFGPGNPPEDVDRALEALEAELA